MKQTPLQRKAPLSATKPLQKGCRKKKRASKRDCRERWRSEEYLAWIRTLPCSLCGMVPSDAHHVIGLGWGLSGMGLTAPDSYSLPLCRYHHGEVHKHVAMQRAQPQWLRWTLNRGIREFTGETREALQRALQFIDEREEAA